MVNITIDFKNNRIYLKRPYLIKGGVYNLSLDSRDPLAKFIDDKVIELLNKGINALATKTKTLYAKNEYIQYDYNPREQSGFLKLIKDNKEIVHLSIFTGKNSTPHLTFKNAEGEKIHIYIANLFLSDFNNNKYNDFKDLKSICRLFYDLLDLIKCKFNSIQTKPEIKYYKIQLLQYINLFMKIFENPRTTKLQDGIEKNENATLENMIDDDTFIEITNRETTEKIAIIKTFIKANSSLIGGLIYAIDTLIKNESLTDITTKIREYKTHNSYPITDKAYAFPKYRIFVSEDSINTFIKEFEEIKQLVESTEITDDKIISDYNTIFINITNINFLFNPGTIEKLKEILDIENTDRQLNTKETKSLPKFIYTCSKKSPLLYEVLNRTNTIKNKVKTIQTSQQQTTQQQTKSTGGKTKPTSKRKTNSTTPKKK